MAGPTVLNLIIGFLVSVGASLMNAIGLNLLKLDHVKNSTKSIDQQRNECGRPLWHIGLDLYVFSQVVGSTVALNFLKAQWVAPLGSLALIFNFIFARVLVGTQITKQDIWGTFIIIASVIWIVVFGGMNEEQNEELDLKRLKELILRPLFIIYFSILNVVTFVLFGVALYSYWIMYDEERKRNNDFYKGIETARLQKWIGISMAGVGGLLASQSLLLAKSGVKLVATTISEHKSQFTDKISWFILLFLMLTAVLQIYCLNTALKLSDSVLVVPIFYGFYTAMGLVNTIIYLDEVDSYPAWALLLVTIGIATLVYGVLLLSEAKDLDENLPDNEDEEIDLDGISSSRNDWETSSLGDGSSTAVSDGSSLHGKGDRRRKKNTKDIFSNTCKWFTMDSIKSSLIGRAFSKGFVKLRELRGNCFGSNKDDDKSELQMEDIDEVKKSHIS